MPHNAQENGTLTFPRRGGEDTSPQVEISPLPRIEYRSDSDSAVEWDDDTIEYVQSEDDVAPPTGKLAGGGVTLDQSD